MKIISYVYRRKEKKRPDVVPTVSKHNVNCIAAQLSTSRQVMPFLFLFSFVFSYLHPSFCLSKDSCSFYLFPSIFSSIYFFFSLVPFKQTSSPCNGHTNGTSISVLSYQQNYLLWSRTPSEDKLSLYHAKQHIQEIWTHQFRLSLDLLFTDTSIIKLFLCWTCIRP